MILLIIFLMVFDISVIHEGSCKKIYGDYNYEYFGDEDYDDEDYDHVEYGDEQYGQYGDDVLYNEEYFNQDHYSEYYDDSKINDKVACVCSQASNPICASDGNTYPNKCIMECEKNKKDSELGFVHRGKCRTKPINCACRKELDTVCGSDGESYANICFLNCAKKFYLQLELVSEGDCYHNPEVCSCTNFFDPMCASDGKTYKNACYLECAQTEDSSLNFVSNGECELLKVSPKNIFSDHLEDICSCILEANIPICASDGKTYENSCKLECAQRSQPRLMFVSNGECKIYGDLSNEYYGDVEDGNEYYGDVEYGDAEDGDEYYSGHDYDYEDSDTYSYILFD